MYKKIKNGSFMNWIWFLLCLIPILIIFLSTFGEGKTFEFGTREETRINNLYLSDNAYNNTDQVVNSNGTITYSYYSTTDLTFQFKANENNTYYYYVVFYSTTYDNYPSPTETNFNYNFTKNNTTLANGTTLQNTLYNGNVELTTSDTFKLILTIDITRVQINAILGLFISTQELEITPQIANWNNYTIITGTNGTLENILDTIQSNGFISNAFLNLAQFFGVNNVYYSLACYYIEYLLIIVLLHLAFDVLYIVPNICHKFMEKIGGERD